MKKILVVEDEQDIMEVMTAKLGMDGYEVAGAFNGLEALEKIKQDKPDLIVLDIMLPEMDGYSVNLKLKENKETENIPVIIMTGRGNLKEILKINEKMAIAAYFEKPFPLKLLSEKIKELI